MKTFFKIMSVICLIGVLIGVCDKNMISIVNCGVTAIVMAVLSNDD